MMSLSPQLRSTQPTPQETVIPATDDRESPSEGPVPLLDHLLAEQQNLTAVERFSQWHEDATEPVQSWYYSSLLPAAAPEAGQQYAFDVDLDACSGCKACVTACHTLNGLDETETWRDVGLLIGGTEDLPVMQHVTSACHHCLEPPCMAACPVDAYEKNPVTGIVKHLDDQCFGCQYCTLACPYDAPKYHSGKGIVRKCDMCSDRLAVGEAPACVQACPHEAIRISVVDQQEVVASSETSLFLPGAHDPQYTLPTTTYRTERVLPRNLLPADYYSVRKQHAHWPLILMLVLTQLSVGAFLVEFTRSTLFNQTIGGLHQVIHAVTSLLAGLLAIGASTLHLGRPQYAFRAIIGLRHSWLSREILAFGLFAPLAVIYAGTLWFEIEGVFSGRWLGMLVVTTGLLGVFCSIMIYQFTRRELWKPLPTGFKFLSTMLLLGISTTLLTSLLSTLLTPGLSWKEMMSRQGTTLCHSLMIVAALKLGFELSIFAHLRDQRNSPMKRSALIMSGELSSVTIARFAAGFCGGVFLPALLTFEVLKGTESDVLILSAGVVLIFLTSLTGELLERYLFFSAVVAPKMPGGLTP